MTLENLASFEVFLVFFFPLQQKLFGILWRKKNLGSSRTIKM